MDTNFSLQPVIANTYFVQNKTQFAGFLSTGSTTFTFSKITPEGVTTALFAVTSTITAPILVDPPIYIANGRASQNASSSVNSLRDKEQDIYQLLVTGSAGSILKEGSIEPLDN